MSEKYPFICNAQIDSATIGFERGFILTAMVHVSFVGGGQGFGGYALGGSPFDDAACANHKEQCNLSADFIGGVLAVAGVEDWASLKGKIIRIGKANEWGQILAIGHPVKDRWYDPSERMTMFRAAAEEEPS